MANLYTKEVIVGMIYVVHVVKRNKKRNPFSCDSVVLLNSRPFFFKKTSLNADNYINQIAKKDWLLQNGNDSNSLFKH